MSDRFDLAQLFGQARDLPPDARKAFVEDAGRDDDELRQELESLLEHADAGERFFRRLGDVVTASSLTPTLKIGRYEIQSCIGVGGMAAVYRARDTRLERDVALKFLPAHRGADALLLMEARTAAALDHVNVCTVYEIGESDDGRSFIAMALYDGQTLRERIRRGALPIDEALDVIKQIARGLGAAHARAIVHRDIKPGNVMLTEGGAVKLLDFGLAGLANAGVGASGVTPGTLAYMSPEQIRGESVGAWSDLWSVGVVAYEMLTGTHPFPGHDANAVRQAILEASPLPLSKLRSEVPVSVERIVLRLLQPESAKRYASAEELLAHLERARARGSVRGKRWRTAAVLAGALAVVMATAVLLRNTWNGAEARATASPGVGGDFATGAARSIAVLPFTNVSRDPEEDYVSDGLTDELIAALAKVRTLRVAARTSAFAFKGQSRDVRDIGRALNVSAVLEGSVQKFGDRIRVRVQLVNVSDGLRIWSDVYERKLEDLFEIQTFVATRIAGALEAEMTSAERARLGRRATTSPEALSLYLKGRYFWHQRTPAAYARAIEHFERAIRIDPRYAAPHVGLASVYSQLGMQGAISPGESTRLTRASTLRALELDDDLAEAHSMLAVYLHSNEWDMDAAEREHLRAVSMEPGNSMIRHLYGNFLRTSGRFDEAVEQQTLAVELDPLAPAFTETLAWSLLRAERPRDAYRRVLDAIELDSTFWRAHAILANVLERLGRNDEALREFERANVLAGARKHRTLADIARVLAHTGRETEARQAIARARAEAQRSGDFDPAVATALMAVGDTSEAWAWLERGYHARTGVVWLLGDPLFSRIADHPRFVDLMQRVGVRRTAPRTAGAITRTPDR
ncbi:MAG: protein kinase domain-containing protein [Gemmatimonadaceae bacterium]